VAEDLQRFVDAQRDTYDRALAELRAGRKQGHWMWFVFPQLRGLGRSETSRFYGLAGLAEAAAYLAHPLLGARLRKACQAILQAAGSAETILGRIDAIKLRSSMTLFHHAAPEDPTFPDVLERFFDGEPDPATDELLTADQVTRDARESG
jgi:uncharacterized protein (DUF1810 family)